MSSPRLLRKLGKHRTFRVLILGQGGVGKTALTVRFITRRFIGEYDPTLEKKYRHTTDVDDEPAAFEILDTAGQEQTSNRYRGLLKTALRYQCHIDPNILATTDGLFHEAVERINDEEITLRMEENIRWADAFILVYDICDVCSFAECTRLKFLVQYAKKSRRQSAVNASGEPLVFLVANKCDLQYDRMISTEEGQKKAKTLECSGFYEISVRESYEEVANVFRDLYRLGRESRRPWLTRNTSSQRTLSVEDPSVPDTAYLSLEEPDKSFKRKPSVSKRIIRAVMSSNRSKSDEHKFIEEAHADSS